MIGCALTALGVTVAAAPPAGGAATPTSTRAETVRLTAAGKTSDVVRDDTEVRVVATERGAAPDGERPAVLEILGGYRYRGQTQAHVLKRCRTTRCEIDPALRTPTTWTYQAFYIGRSGTVLAKSRIVKVQWVRPASTATGP